MTKELESLLALDSRLKEAFDRMSPTAQSAVELAFESPSVDLLNDREILARTLYATMWVAREVRWEDLREDTKNQYRQKVTTLHTMAEVQRLFLRRM